MKRRIVSLLLSLALVLGLLPVAVLQAGAAKSADDWAKEITCLNQVEKDLVAAIRAGKTAIDISSYQLTPEKIQLDELVDYSPYISNGISIKIIIEYKTGRQEGTYAKIEITCPMSKSEVNKYYDKVDARIAEIDAMLAAVPDETDKVLVLHDYLAYHSEYDTAMEVSPDSFNTAGNILNGRGVCQGYTYAFMYFMNRAGIECHSVKSVPMNHTWNVVKLGNEYYHVDSTWDDPTPDVSGMVGHKFLLLSDKALGAKRAIGGNRPHVGWDPLPVSCSSAAYDYAYWYGVDSPVLLSGSDRYYCKDGSIIRRDVKTGTETVLQTLEPWQVWGDEDTYYDNEFYTGLYLRDGRLYYNTATELRYLDINTLEDKAVCVPDTSAGFIYGSAVVDGVMYYELKQEKKDTGVRCGVPLEKLTGDHPHSYKAGAVTAPTCTKQGYTTYVCECGDSYRDAFVDALGHDWDGGKTTVQPTEKEKGTKTFTCKRCKETRTEELPKLTHQHSYTTDVTAPTCTEQGYTTHTCTSCNESFKDTYVNALGHDYKDGVCMRCGAKQPVMPLPTDFKDVTPAAWYYEAVNYAVSNGLMNGVGNNNFAPDDPMTRSMLVTVLWRYEGSPKEGTNDFTDVPAGQWYTDAVAWAATNGIVGGVGNGRFDPNGNITREQMAAILYRYADKKGFDTAKRGDLSGFPDQNKVSAYATDAIAWAVAEKIIGGSNGKLDPQGNATRAQVSTILMRFIEGIAKK